MSQKIQTAEQMSVQQMAGEERQQVHAPKKKERKKKKTQLEVCVFISFC